MSILAEGATLPALAEVSGYVAIRGDGPNLPALVKADYVDISAEGATLPALVKSGYMRIHAKGATLPMLVESGSLYIEAEGASLPVLAKVSGSVVIEAKGASLPALAKVSGSVDIRPEKADFQAPKLYAKGFDNFRFYDGISYIVLSSRKKGDVEILSCRRAQIKAQKIIGEKLFIAKKGDQTAHALDIKTALEELAFKTGERDIEQYKNMPKSTCKSPQDWAYVYRMVTGACQYGTKDFMERKGKLKKTYTLSEILEETKGAFGHEAFRRVVAG